MENSNDFRRLILFLKTNKQMTKNIPEDKHLPKRIAEVQMDIANGINVEENEDLLDSLMERQRSGNVLGSNKYTKVSRKQAKSFN